MTFGPYGVGGGCPSCKTLTADRDELQRRIKSITEILTDLAGNPHAMLDAHEVLCVLAIAEGRTE